MACCSPSETRARRRLARWFALAVLVAVAAGATDASEPPLEVQDAGGARVELALEPGVSALVVHFWASWCPECSEELPVLAAVAAGCGNAVRIVAVNVGESVETARAFLDEHALRLPLWRDPDGRTFRRVATGLPANLIWTRDGREISVGPKRRAEWQERLVALGCDAASPR